MVMLHYNEKIMAARSIAPATLLDLVYLPGLAAARFNPEPFSPRPVRL